MLFSWFDTAEAAALGKRVAERFIAEIPLTNFQKTEKNLARQAKVVEGIDREIEQFQAKKKLNALKKAKLADAFQNTLLAAGYERQFVLDVTKRVVMKMAYGKESF
jgi:hypothetical protein